MLTEKILDDIENAKELVGWDDLIPLARLGLKSKQLQAENLQMREALEESEKFRHAYRKAKLEMAALGDDKITDAIMKYMPCNEGALERNATYLIRLSHTQKLADRIKALEELVESGFIHEVICKICNGVSKKGRTHDVNCWFGQKLSKLDALEKE